MLEKTMKKNIENKVIKKKEINKQVLTPILFGLAIILFFIILIPGESAWLFVHNVFLGLFGFCSILWPAFIFCISLMMAFEKNSSSSKLKFHLSYSLILILCVEFYIFSINSGVAPNKFGEYIGRFYKSGTLWKSSGAVGALIGTPFTWLIGITGFRIINSIVLLVSLMLLTGVSLKGFLETAFTPFAFLKGKLAEYKKNKQARAVDKTPNPIQENLAINRQKSKIDISIDNLKSNFKKGVEQVTQIDIDRDSDDLEVSEIPDSFNKKAKEPIKKSGEDNQLFKEGELKVNVNEKSDGYEFPLLKFLNKSTKMNENLTNRELQINGKMLVDILRSFNVETSIVDFSRGPAVTRYELQPASGVKISKITNLADDIALNFAASGVRIEAPIPGKAAVGVEIPNKVVSVVNMNELISSDEFINAKSKLSVVLGRDISGRVVVADLGKMPHILIAGSTGSGKSVCINSFIVSLLYKASPDEVKLIMIDPKVVELGVYNGIPHLLIPVVTDPKKAKGALSWSVEEMLRRYKIFAENNVRDMHSYNSYVDRNKGIKDKDGNELVKMYSIIIIIDELSDLMMAAPNEIEDYICRLAQMARAAGMHLVIATQRPSVDVITGIIKANIPSRIALAVSSQVDSRTILDMSGAEKLLGRGDMLFSPIGSNKPLRVQGCYVTDSEIENITNYIKVEQSPEYDSEIIEKIDKNAEMDKKNSTDSQEDSEKDPLLNSAIECVVSTGQASVSLLQRKLDIGYPRAGRLIDKLEKMGIIGPHEGSKPRQVLINQQQFLELKTKDN